MAWTQLANTSLELSTFWTTGNVFSSVSLPKTQAGNNLRSATIDAWVSGDLDTKRGRFTFPCGGGHLDWWGNQVLAYVPTSSWKLLRTASSAYVATGSTQSSPRNLDGTPASKHTYDTVCYMASVDKFYCGSGIYWWDGGSSPQVVWWWDPVTEQYTEKAVRPGGYASATVWDPVNNVMYLRTSAGFYSYNPLVELSAPNPSAYTLLFSQTAANTAASTLVIDTLNHRVYRIEQRSASNPNGGLKVIDLNNLQLKEKTLPTSGDVEIETGAGMAGGIVVGYAPGLVFDSASSRLVGLGPSTTFSTALRSGEWAVYSAVVPQSVSTNDNILWLRDPSGTQPQHSSGALLSSNAVANGSHGMYKKWFAYGGTYYGIALNGMSTGDVWSYTPSWAATQNILDQVTDLNIQVTT